MERAAQVADPRADHAAPRCVYSLHQRRGTFAQHWIVQHFETTLSVNNSREDVTEGSNAPRESGNSSQSFPSLAQGQCPRSQNLCRRDFNPVAPRALGGVKSRICLAD